MVRLIVAASSMAMLSVGMAWAAILLFDSLLIFGESTLQTVFVFGFYIYCALSLFFPSEHKLFYVLSIPVLSQFLHLFQKYDFPAGANSLWRLLPFLLADLYMFSTLIRYKTNLTGIEKGLIASWVVFNFLFIAISPNISGIITGAFVLLLVTIPSYFLYLNMLCRHPSFPELLERSLCLTFILLALGTFGLVFFGAQYRGASNLLVTRNISDTNVTMAYFILLWPFTIHYAMRTGYSWLLLPLFILLFALVVILSFSRGAVLIVLPYLLVSIRIVSKWKHLLWLMALGILLVAGFDRLMYLINPDLAYSWQLRFADFQTVGPVLQKIQEVSGRVEIRRLAYQLFLDSPLFGHGTGSFELLGPGYREAHSMFFTILAEQGLVGILYLYGLFAALGCQLLKATAPRRSYRILPITLGCYLLFVHSVGYVFVIIPARSLTINCIAPVLLICIYYYSKIAGNKSITDRG
ncbi:O-antigen ligase [Dyadobacter sp.]|uniref:O-antigen ligase family protein n=1 Tax=Dyadobacter sp. TaxID=1914288 RepID=UPI0025C1BFD6|nr:O-antigen ligase family protein [Dyadobacter sp.]